MSIFWCALLALALLWPARLAGPLDGVPLDQPIEVAVAALLAVLVAANRHVLASRQVRLILVVMLSWKAVSAVTLTQDGWCLRFTSPRALYLDDVRVPHSWDVRADWRSAVPRCSAVMTRDYPELEYFPAWFFNLPPADPGRQAIPEDRPPLVQTEMRLDGYLSAASPGRLQIQAGEDVHARALIGDRAVSAAELSNGIDIAAGVHHIVVDADLVRSHWSLALRWNDAPPWSKGVLTMAPPGVVDRWVRPWGNWVPALLTAWLFVVVCAHVLKTVASPAWTLAIVSASLALGMVGWSRHDALMRMAPIALLAMAARVPPTHLQTLGGATILITLPWLAFWLPRAAGEAGLFTWYSAGDDWWMFQRFAYRIYMQGYWLHGGEATFWFQPLYRWTAGALHLVFGDSSVGELLWDAAAAGIAALFAFHVVRRIAGFRWATTAAVLVLSTFTLGPAWHLIGRGLSEFSSAGLLYAAALLAMHARSSPAAAIGAGLAASLAMFTRLNNLPMALAVAAFALPLTVTAGDVWRPARWRAELSRPVLAGVLGAMAVALWLFTARTYYYTGVPSMLHGTTAGLNSVWSGPGGSIALVERLVSSLMMLLTMNDPPRFDPRSLLVIAGFVAACLGLARVPPVAGLPLSLSLFALSGIAGGFVARGTAYPGRFSVHLIPVCTAIGVIVVADVMARLRGRRLLPAQPQDAGDGQHDPERGDAPAVDHAVG